MRGCAAGTFTARDATMSLLTGEWKHLRRTPPGGRPADAPASPANHLHLRRLPGKGEEKTFASGDGPPQLLRPRSSSVGARGPHRDPSPSSRARAARTRAARTRAERARQVLHGRGRGPHQLEALPRFRLYANGAGRSRSRRARAHEPKAARGHDRQPPTHALDVRTRRDRTWCAQVAAKAPDEHRSHELQAVEELLPPRLRTARRRTATTRGGCTGSSRLATRRATTRWTSQRRKRRTRVPGRGAERG